MMFIISDMALKEVEAAIVTATHGTTTETGGRADIGTIDSRRLEMAALTAVQIALGEPAWPSNRPITVPRRARLPGPFVEE